MTSKERAFIVESIEMRMNFTPQSEDQMNTAASIVVALKKEMRLANGLEIKNQRTRGQKELTRRSQDLMVPESKKKVDWNKELRKLREQK